MATIPEPINVLAGILYTIKKMLGLDPIYTAFDTDIIVNINTVLMSLSQMGVGPADGYSITGTSEEWEDYLGEATNLEAVKSYIYLKVRLLFDPPASSSVMDAIGRQITELEWRLTIQNDVIV